MEPDGVARILEGVGAIRFGEYELSSGKKSPYYVDMRSVPSSPPAFRGIVGALLGAAEAKIGLGSFDVLASVPTGGLVFASALAIESAMPLVYVRTAAKGHGTLKSVEGKLPPGARVLIVDDVATTGGSVAYAVGELRKLGAEITDALAVVDRMEGAGEALGGLGVRLHSVATMAEIGAALHKSGRIDDSMMSAIRAHTGGK